MVECDVRDNITGLYVQTRDGLNSDITTIQSLQWKRQNTQ